MNSPYCFVFETWVPLSHVPKETSVVDHGHCFSPHRMCDICCKLALVPDYGYYSLGRFMSCK